jgi:hypothetical protein
VSHIAGHPLCEECHKKYSQWKRSYLQDPRNAFMNIDLRYQKDRELFTSFIEKVKREDPLKEWGFQESSGLKTCKKLYIKRKNLVDDFLIKYWIYLNKHKENQNDNQ